MNRWLSGEWAVQRTSAKTRRTLHYWATVVWVTVGTVVWIVLRDVLWFVGFMSLYAIWVTHLAGGRQKRQSKRNKKRARGD